MKKINKHFKENKLLSLGFGIMLISSGVNSIHTYSMFGVFYGFFLILLGTHILGLFLDN